METVCDSITNLLPTKDHVQTLQNLGERPGCNVTVELGERILKDGPTTGSAAGVVSGEQKLAQMGWLSFSRLHGLLFLHYLWGPRNTLLKLCASMLGMKKLGSGKHERGFSDHCHCLFLVSGS